MGEWMKLAEKDRVERYVESFRRLADIFQQMPSRKEYLEEEDILDIFENLRQGVCADCGRRGACWGKYAEKTEQIVCGLLGEIEEDRKDATDMDKLLYRQCIKGRSVKEELKNSFFQAKLNMLWSNRMLENRAAVAEQLSQTAGILEEIACAVFDAGESEKRLEQRLKFHLHLHRVIVKDLRILNRAQGHPEIILTILAVRGCCVSVKEVGRLLSQFFGRRIVPERDSRVTVGREACTIHFVEETAYYMITGAAMEICDGQTTSGDNFAVSNGNHGRVILSLSDGMGCGVEAGRESQTVIELLEQFLDAGFSTETAVKMINSSMVLQRGMRTFSTLDICQIDLYDARCRVLKIGASTTFIRRKDYVEVLTSASLPVGVLQEPDYESSVRALEDGDLVVMVTDGVMDALPDRESEELMKYLIMRLPSENPAKAARRLLDEVLGFCEEGAKDDMTILTGGFWKK
ncbi:MAG: SpoIIE family protein phosphatase [Eubacteriales bacterium]|nr:SpoIIE family protein phosphatase [Eubacteriales bacterium]